MIPQVLPQVLRKVLSQGDTSSSTSSSNDLDGTQTRICGFNAQIGYGFNYKKDWKSKMNICSQCGYHFQMSSSDRIELLIDRARYLGPYG